MRSSSVATICEDSSPRGYLHHMLQQQLARDKMQFF